MAITLDFLGESSEDLSYSVESLCHIGHLPMASAPQKMCPQMQNQ